MKILLFDLDDTLFDFKKAEAAAFTETMKEHGLCSDEEHHQLYESINQGMWKALERNEITKEELKNTRFKKYLEASDQSFDDRILTQSYTHHLSCQGMLIDGAYEVVSALAKQWPCYGATNGITEIQQGRLAVSGLGKLFKGVFISETMNCKKPDLAFFEKIFEALSCTHEDVILIGDSLSADIQGGINADIQTIWYNPACLTNTTAVQPTYEIHDLHELLDLVKEI